eukprot:501480-Rhodomonas_salina.1
MKGVKFALVRAGRSTFISAASGCILSWHAGLFLARGDAMMLRPKEGTRIPDLRLLGPNASTAQYALGPLPEYASGPSPEEPSGVHSHDFSNDSVKVQRSGFAKRQSIRVF